MTSRLVHSNKVSLHLLRKAEENQLQTCLFYFRARRWVISTAGFLNLCVGDRNLDRGTFLAGTRKNVKHIITTKEYHFVKSVKSSISVNLITCSDIINVDLHVIL